MSKTERPSKSWNGEDGRVLNLTWSRSGRNLIVTVARDGGWRENQQMLLDPTQVVELAEFLQRGPDDTAP